ncbi:MAG: glutamine amidotransferase [Pseudomonadota bacterium]
MDRDATDDLTPDIEPAWEPGAQRRVLVILHQAHSVPGRLGERLERRGFTLEPRRPAVGDPLPDCLADYSAIVVFGGPQSANDTHDYIRAELDLVGRAMAREVPLLGICLGAQLMARALGAQVGRHRDGLCERGYYPLRPTPVGAGLLPWPSHVYHWHAEGFDLPQGAQLLAAGDVFPNQAFRYGSSAYALQFHPEVTQAMMCRWTTVGAERLTHPGAQPAEAHHAGWSQYDPAVCRWLDGFLDAWIGLTVGRNTAHRTVTARA